MVSTQFRSQFQKIGRRLVLGVSVLALTFAFAAPSMLGSAAESTSTDVAWRGRVYRRAYYGPVVPVVPVIPVAPVAPVYRAPLLRPYYAPVYGPTYYGSPYGGAVVSPYGGVYW